MPSFRHRAVASAATMLLAAPMFAQTMPAKTDTADAVTKPAQEAMQLVPPDSTTTAALDAGGQHISYQAIAGTLPVGGSNAVDAMLAPDGTLRDGKPHSDPENGPPIARMSYVYYAETGTHGPRPITFLYNGGPGSSTMWLLIGSIGPKRVVTADHTNTGAPPYQVVDNPYSLLPTSDLVFIDMPGTGFGVLEGKDPGKAFWGLDEDAGAFARFIERFVTKYNRWNSPKYIFGESYGTTRSALLADVLTNDRNIGLNGVILLSQILSFDDVIDGPPPGDDTIYALALPSYAAVAAYHHKLPQQPADLQALLKEAETFAMGPYLNALVQGDALPADEEQSIAEKMHALTGLPVDYLVKANLRVNGGEFEHALLGDEGETTGRLDARFAGPSMDPLDKSAGYDPGDASLGNAYTAAINQYMRETLHFGEGYTFKPSAYAAQGFHWNWSRGGGDSLPSAPEVLTDLAAAMKQNTTLQVMVNGGYYDLGTPFYAALYQDQHLPIPRSLNSHIEYDWYESGHMVYAHEQSLRELHDRVAAFITRTQAGGPAKGE